MHEPPFPAAARPRPGHHRVVRGGSSNNTTATHVRAAYRNDHTPMNRNNNIGFRCSRARNAGVPAATAVGSVHLLPPPTGFARSA